MLYLFNSGFTGLYKTNLLNTLFLPNGTLNSYRYGEKNVEPAVFANPQLAAGHKDGVIVFIDRHANNGYQFIPIRRIRYFDVAKDADYLHFRVVMLDFIYPKDLAAFNLALFNALQSLGLPKLTNGDPQNTNDGRYAILAKDPAWDKGIFLGPNEAWTAAVDEIAKRQSVAHPTLVPIFAKCRILDKKTNISPKRLLKKQFGRFALRPAKEYEVELSLRHPRYNEKGDATLSITSTDSIKWIDAVSIPVSSSQNRVCTRMTTKRYAEDSSGSLHLTTQTANVLIANASIYFAIHQKYWYWPAVVLTLCVYAISTVFIGIDSKDIHESWSAHLAFELLVTHWPIVVASLIQTIVLFVMFRLIGQKPI